MQCFLFNYAYLLGQYTYLVPVAVAICAGNKESRKLKVILFEFLLHKCGEFEFAQLQMEFAAEYYKIYEVFPFSLCCCMH